MEPIAHSHVFIGETHARAERQTWIVIAICGAMMILEIVGGALFGSIALMADGLHMSTHAGALLLAALAYRYARRHAEDARFTFGTGKVGDLAGFTSAVVLAMIALLIGYEAVGRLLSPVPIHFSEAIPIAVLGLGVNVVTAWLLSRGDHRHDHSHAHSHDHGGADHDHASDDHAWDDHAWSDQAPAAHRDNNLRAAIVHVAADAVVSVLVIVGLLLARGFGWMWMDPLAGLVGALVVASWAYGLVRDTSAILLDVNPDRALETRIRGLVETDGDRLSDLHLWRLGPGHLGAILAVITREARDPQFYRDRLAGLSALAHVTVEVQKAA